MKTTVGEVMSSPAIVVAPGAPFKEIVETLQEHRIGALPVVDADGRVIGVVSESDLLLKEERRDLEAERHLLPSRRAAAALARAAGTTARELMTGPAITIGPEARIDRAARLLLEHQVDHLPVVDDDRRPRGMLARGDLLDVFLRSDEQIRAAVVDDLLVGTLWLDPAGLTIEVADGVVRVAGELPRKTDVQLVERLVPTLDGVVGVEAELTYRFDDTRVHPEPSQPYAPPEW